MILGGKEKESLFNTPIFDTFLESSVPNKPLDGQIPCLLVSGTISPPGKPQNQQLSWLVTKTTAGLSGESAREKLMAADLWVGRLTSHNLSHEGN